MEQNIQGFSPIASAIGANLICKSIVAKYKRPYYWKYERYRLQKQPVQEITRFAEQYHLAWIDSRFRGNDNNKVYA